MALKDWKTDKTPFYNILTHWQNQWGGVVEVSFDADELGNPSHYTVFINDRRILKNNKNFKTKSQALAFAKKYMRSH